MIINVVLSQQHSHALGKHDEWTGGREMDSEEFVSYFMEPFMSGYRQENTLTLSGCTGCRSSSTATTSRSSSTRYGSRLQAPFGRGAGCLFSVADSRQLEDEVAGNYWDRFDFSRFA